MKKVFAIAFFAGIFIAAMPTLASASPLQDYYDDGPVTYQTFYDELSPYGNWIDDPEYGYVWQPNVGGDFRPYYSNGNWQYTTYGWTWVSSYNWGWAPFHYGRWRVDPYYGWVWIPGYEWGPAWVSWRNNSGYCGWAPMAPGISISVSFSSGYSVPYDNWCFLPTRYLGVRSFWNHCIPFRQNNVYINNTVIVQNTYVYNRRTYVQGPDASYYRRATGRNLAAAAIRSERRPGMDRVARNEVRMYRPEVRQFSNSGGNNTRPAPAPQRVTSRNDGNRNNISQPNGRDGNNWTRNDNNNIRRPETRDNNRNTPDRRFDNQWSRDDNNSNPVRENRNNLPERNSDRNNSNPVRENRNNLPERNSDRNNSNPVRDNRNNLPESNFDRNNSNPVRENRNNLPERNINRPENNNRTFERNVPNNSRPEQRSIPQRTPDNSQQRRVPEQRQVQQERSRSFEQPRQSTPNRSYERQDRSSGRQPSAAPSNNNNSRGNNNERAARRG